MFNSTKTYSVIRLFANNYDLNGVNTLIVYKQIYSNKDSDENQSWLSYNLGTDEFFTHFSDLSRSPKGLASVD